jgi:hypothetical protein
MPTAQSYDGVMHEFPEGTAPDVVDRVMREYAVNRPVPPSSSALDATGFQSRIWDDYGNTLPDATESAAKLGNNWWMNVLANGASRLDHLRDGLAAGKTYGQIGQELGASYSAVRDRALASGWESSPTGMHPGSHVARTWTDAENAAIRQAVIDRVPTRQLADQMGTSQGTIARQINALGLRSEALGQAPMPTSSGRPVTLPHLRFLERDMAPELEPGGGSPLARGGK